MRQSLRDQLEEKEIEIEESRKRFAEISQENVKILCRDEGFQRSLKELMVNNDQLREEANRCRQQKVIAEARLNGFIEATRLFLEYGKAGINGQN